ncbi:multiple antibiotic resistance protein [Ancylobacter sp. 3268]|uniref:MarC family protein n=1 Tax=Ancylobacter sp. 3268 TaxID=2817752 RepID=UPI00285D2DE5|nr:MarC family protein [Ancylobacter sp. 3268]MDR6952867.1 multiple antibiotic resistance protein [Ancylobacter sp. 3268]
MDVTLTAKLFAALFAIMNPLSTIPVFLALTADLTPPQRRSALIAMIVTVTAGALVCALAGQAALSLFGIDVPHFRLAGGLIVLMIALSMLSGDDHSSHQGTEAEQQHFETVANVGVYPLGLPIALGPGTMATLIVFAQEAHGTAGVTGYYAGLIGYLVFFAAAMALAPVIGSKLSPTALSVSKRLMGIILAAIAMEMITGALGSVFPGWRH